MKIDSLSWVVPYFHFRTMSIIIHTLTKIRKDAVTLNNPCFMNEQFYFHIESCNTIRRMVNSKNWIFHITLSTLHFHVPYSSLFLYFSFSSFLFFMCEISMCLDVFCCDLLFVLSNWSTYTLYLYLKQFVWLPANPNYCTWISNSHLMLSLLL